MKKALIVFGTRPEAIKMAPIVIEFQRHRESIETIVCVTGQHREMLDQVLNLFNIKPDYDLNIMKREQDLFDITSRIMLSMRDVLTVEKPDITLVHGDTTTSTIVAIACFYKHIPVYHVEAGLRTYNINSPWPEELNRQITARIAEYHFAPTQECFNNLINEGIERNKISITGNSVIDALQIIRKKTDNSLSLRREIQKELKVKGYNTNHSEDRKIILVTGHRRENIGTGFVSICMAIKHLAKKFPDIDFIYPMHPNPNIRKTISEVFNNDNNNYSNLYLIEPLEYHTFIYIMARSYLILTDSGGIQEEAPGFGKPVLVMRDTTERPEAVKAGTVRLVGTDFNTITHEVSTLITNMEEYNKMSKAINPFGDGKTANRIFEITYKRL